MTLKETNQPYQIHLGKPVLDDFWLTGFFEGDGSLLIYQTKQKVWRFYFVLPQAEPQVLFKVKSYLGFGSVYQDSQGYWTYSVSNQQGLLKVAKLINGKLILNHRLHQYQVWVEGLNQKYGWNLVPVETPGSLSLDHSWLCGFADAEGSFNLYLGTRRDNGRPRLRLRFYLSQSYDLESMQRLQAWLGGTLFSKQSKDHLCLKLDTFQQAGKIVAYFSRFPPLTLSLKVRFLRYARVYRWVQLKEWPEKVEQIQHLITLNKRLKKQILNYGLGPKSSP